MDCIFLGPQIFLINNHFLFLQKQYMYIVEYQKNHVSKNKIETNYFIPPPQKMIIVHHIMHNTLQITFSDSMVSKNIYFSTSVKFYLL